jgi:hypothetical protein
MKEDIIRMAREAGAERNPDFPDWSFEDDQLERFFHMAQAAERNKVAQWMMTKGYATGHGDTVEDLLRELEWQVADRCAEIAYEAEPWHSADLIREAFGVKK